MNLKTIYSTSPARGWLPWGLLAPVVSRGERVVHDGSILCLRVAIVDEEPIARTRFARLLNTIGGCFVQVVLECGTAEEFLDSGPRAELDAAFVNIEMPDGDEAIAGWSGRRPRLVVMTTTFQQPSLQAFDPGAMDCLTQPVSEGRLQETLERAFLHRLASLRGRSLTAGSSRTPILTARQLDVLRLVANRKSNKEIGRLLELSHFTVRNHLSILYRVFGVDTRLELMSSASVSETLERAAAQLLDS